MSYTSLSGYRCLAAGVSQSVAHCHVALSLLRSMPPPHTLSHSLTLSHTPLCHTLYFSLLFPLFWRSVSVAHWCLQPDGVTQLILINWRFQALTMERATSISSARSSSSCSTWTKTPGDLGSGLILTPPLYFFSGPCRMCPPVCCAVCVVLGTRLADIPEHAHRSPCAMLILRAIFG